jgi:uncharacterized membrane protein YwaF
MLWGTFSLAHILSLVFAVILNIGLYFILKKCPKWLQLTILGILSLSGIAAIIYNLVTWNSPLEYLPFHLCSLNAMILPFAVLTRNKVVSNLTLLWSLGAAVALVLNQAVAAAEILDPVFCFYFFPHVFEMGVPILLFKLGLCKLDSKCIFSTVGITAAAYTAIHFINVAINNYCIENNILDWAGNVVQVNYMYSLVPDNPVLALFYGIIPYQFWYMLPAVGIAAVYLAAIYGIHHLITKKKAQ